MGIVFVQLVLFSIEIRSVFFIFYSRADLGLVDQNKIHFSYRVSLEHFLCLNHSVGLPALEVASAFLIGPANRRGQ